MPTITLPKGSLVTLSSLETTPNSVTLSEHGRSELDIQNEAIRVDTRLANASMRRYQVAVKRKLSLSWDMLPAVDGQTLDGKAGRNTLRAIWEGNFGPITLTYKEVNSSNVQVDKSVTVFIESYSETLVRRWGFQFWTCSMSFVEQ